MNLAIAFAALSASIIVIATAYGIGNLGSNAVQSIARQPEAADKIRATMILAAGLIEGVALLCAVICLLVILQS